MDAFGLPVSSNGLQDPSGVSLPNPTQCWERYGKVITLVTPTKALSTRPFLISSTARVRHSTPPIQFESMVQLGPKIHQNYFQVVSYATFKIKMMNNFGTFKIQHIRNSISK